MKLTELLAQHGKTLEDYTEEELQQLVMLHQDYNKFRGYSSRELKEIMMLLNNADKKWAHGKLTHWYGFTCNSDRPQFCVHYAGKLQPDTLERRRKESERFEKEMNEMPYEEYKQLIEAGGF